MTPEQRIADLELRLDRYHEHLADAIAQRDRLALDAAWGVTCVFAGTIPSTIILVIAYVMHADTLWWVAAWVASSVIYWAAWARADRMRMKEIDTLAELPEWDWRG